MRRRLVWLLARTDATRMLTLTVSSNHYPDPSSAARRVAWAFPRLIADLRKRFPSEPLEYLAVWERTKAGWPHLHVLIRGPYLPQPVVSRLWASLTGAPNVWLTALGSGAHGGRYVAKYLTKDPDPFLQGRAIRASRNMLPEPMRPQGKRTCTFGKMTIVRESVWDWLQAHLTGLELVDLTDHGLAIARPWSAFSSPESVLWLRWEKQKAAVASRTRPPPSDEPPDWTSIFTDTSPAAPGAPVTIDTSCGGSTAVAGGRRASASAPPPTLWEG